MESIFKVLLLGDSGVGKTSLLVRHTDGKFSPDLKLTVGVDFKTSKLSGQAARLHIWDTAGQEGHARIISAYFRGAHGVLLVCDVSDASSLESLQTRWLPELRKVNDTAIVKMLCNKSDLRHDPQFKGTLIDVDKLALAAKDLGCDRAIETSAKDEKNEAFRDALRELTDAMGEAATAKDQATHSQQSQAVNLARPKTVSSASCCGSSSNSRPAVRSHEYHAQ